MAAAERAEYLAAWSFYPDPVVYDHCVDVYQGVPEPEPRRPTVREIILSVCKKHEVDIREVMSTTRTRRVVYCRMECCYEIRCNVLINGRPISLPEIARHLGGLDHTTVLYGIRKHAERNGLELPA
jgi:chromosomal replication initiation ATPase DnaA